MNGGTTWSRPSRNIILEDPIELLTEQNRRDEILRLLGAAARSPQPQTRHLALKLLTDRSEWDALMRIWRPKADSGNQQSTGS